jgi:hypothetical protein
MQSFSRTPLTTASPSRDRLMMSFVLTAWIAAILWLTSCNSPAAIETARTVTQDTRWTNSGISTQVATVQGSEPQAQIHVVRNVSSSSAVISVDPNGKFIYGPPQTATAYIFGGTWNNGADIAKSITTGYNQIGSIRLTGAGLTASGNLLAVAPNRVFGGYIFNSQLSPLTALSGTVSLDAATYTLSDTTFAVPETLNITAPQQYDTVKTSDNLTVRFDKPAAQGVETEILFYSSNYNVEPLVKTVEKGTTSVVLTSSDLQAYVQRASAAQYGLGGEFLLAVRVKTAKPVNDGKVALVGISMNTIRLAQGK